MKRVLTIAGSDSGGGAGIQADLKAITVLGGYGMSVLTALTAQNTVGVQAVHHVPEDFIARQMDAVLSDIGADSAKTGMLATAAIVTVVAEGLRRHGVPIVVVDPVMVAKGGDPLLSPEAGETIRTALLPLAHVVTPNIPEAEVLSGLKVRGRKDMEEAARRIHGLGPRHVLVKGGHLEGPAVDLLFDGARFETFEAPRLQQRNTHGTGCTLSAALATYLAEGLPIEAAVAKAKQFITRAIALGLPIGAGHGPTNPYAHVLRWKDREQVLRDLQEALYLLLEHPLGGLVPEVRSSLGYALPGAQGYDEVAAVPGRITQHAGRLLVCKDPVFGASRHIARVILAVMGRFPEYRSAMNIRYRSDLLSVCRELGMRPVSFDRRDEPREVKEREGSTLEWGTLRALENAGFIPDCVYDEGDVGKEPMIRVLGKDPGEVVDKVIRIGKACRDLG